MNNANEILTQLFQSGDAGIASIGDVLLAMSVATCLCFMLSFTYRITHRGTSYSQSFLMTLFLMGVCTSVVMLIIGSNIARAFSLVGALSIIRFRTAMKDPRDTGFLFAAMIAGMGCGTQFYMAAIVMTVFVCVLTVILYSMDHGLKKNLETIVKITFKDNDESAVAVQKVLDGAFRSAKLINRALDFGEDLVTNVYVARPGKNFNGATVEKEFKKLEAVTRVAIYETDQHSAP